MKEKLDGLRREFDDVVAKYRENDTAWENAGEEAAYAHEARETELKDKLARAMQKMRAFRTGVAEWKTVALEALDDASEYKFVAQQLQKAQEHMANLGFHEEVVGSFNADGEQV